MLDRLQDGAFAYELDDGSHVQVAITLDRRARRARIDFTGSSPQQPTNFNAPPSICRAAVLYVMRTLVDEAIPMNDGCLEPIDIVIPEGSLLSPTYPSAVVAGNVETSQVITDALYGATNTMAAAQGTMNNFTFGNARHQYYETICGGCGAGPDFDGASAVHSHMTNSRITDPEVLEWRFPVLLEAFEVRQGSGGAGRRSGGDGVRRVVRFREPMTATILSNRRRVAALRPGRRPAGRGRPQQRAPGRWDGAGGRLHRERADGRRRRLRHRDAGRRRLRPGLTAARHVPAPERYDGGGGRGLHRRPLLHPAPAADGRHGDPLRSPRRRSGQPPLAVGGGRLQPLLGGTEQGQEVHRPEPPGAGGA